MQDNSEQPNLARWHT